MLLDGRWRGRLLDLVRQSAEFSGVEVFTYAMMGNHFHLLVRVEAQREVSDEELAARMASIYTPNQLAKKLADWARWDANPKMEWRSREERDRLKRRMFSLPEFVKTFSERFAEEYNRTTGSTGSPWGQRFKSVLVEKSAATLVPIAAYIDLNPIRAGIAVEPGESAWTGLGAALRGDRRARKGLASLLSHARGVEPMDWEKTLSAYRAALDGRLAIDAAKTGVRPRSAEEKTGSVPGSGDGRKKFDREEVARKIAAGEALTLFELLRCRVRQFCAGHAIGSARFAEEAGRRILRRSGAPFAVRCVELAGVGTAGRVVNAVEIEE